MTIPTINHCKVCGRPTTKSTYCQKCIDVAKEKHPGKNHHPIEQLTLDELSDLAKSYRSAYEHHE